MKASLRPFLKEDAAHLAEIMCASIEELTQDEYDEDQRLAWISVLEDGDAFIKRLMDQLTILAIVEGEPVGFASLRGKDELDLLFVHPDVVREGIGSMLVDALEKLAAARGATTMLTNASETARPFFEKRGYAAQSRNTVMIGGEWLVNTAMRKELGGQKGTLQ